MFRGTGLGKPPTQTARRRTGYSAALASFARSLGSEVHRGVVLDGGHDYGRRGAAGAGLSARAGLGPARCGTRSAALQVVVAVPDAADEHGPLGVAEDGGSRILVRIVAHVHRVDGENGLHASGANHRLSRQERAAFQTLSRLNRTCPLNRVPTR